MHYIALAGDVDLFQEVGNFNGSQFLFEAVSQILLFAFTTGLTQSLQDRVPSQPVSGFDMLSATTISHVRPQFRINSQE